MTAKQFYSLRDIAELWRCSHSSVLSLVRTGQLRAVNISTNPAGRSRYVVSVDALADFEERRTVSAPITPVKRRAKIKRDDIIEFIR